MSGDPVLAALARLEGKFDEGFERIDERFERLEGRINERFERIDERFERLEGRIERLETGQTRLRVDLMGRMDRLQEQVQAVDGLLTMGLGHADEAQEQARAATEGNRIHVEQIRILRDLFRKLDSRVRQLEEKR